VVSEAFASDLQVPASGFRSRSLHLSAFVADKKNGRNGTEEPQKVSASIPLLHIADDNINNVSFGSW